MKQRRERGKLLNEEALARLEAATRAKWDSDARITQEQMAELWAVDTRTVRRILSRKIRVDIATLMEAFSRVGLKLNPGTDLHSDRLQFPDTMPLYPTRLIGRENEVEKLSKYLRTDLCRVVSLTGIGGIGKTRLAVEVARNLASDYLYAVWFAPMVSGSESKLVSDLVRRLGLSPYLSAQPLDTLAGFLNSVGGPILLILDNFQIRAEPEAEVVEALLRRVPTLQIVITSRHDPVGLADPYPYRVPPLSRAGQNVPSGGYVTGQAMRGVPIPPAVALFVETVQAAKPDFRIGPESLEAIVALCDRLDRIPLAITLIAGWMMSLDSVAQIQGRLEGEGLLKMSEVLDETYELVSETLRTIFRHLSIFRDGWTLEAAEAVCDSSSLQDSLDALKAWSLLFEEQTPLNDQPPRLRMFHTLREYGETKLSSYEKQEARRRHLQFFLAFAETACEQLHGPDQMQWLKRLEADHGNLCAALEFCLSEPDTGEEALRLVSRLCDYLRDRGYVHEGSEYVAQALHHPGARASTCARGDALYAAGTFAVAKGEYAQARSWYRECITIRKSLGDRLGWAEALFGIGLAFKMQSSLNEARAYYQQSLLLLRAEKSAAVTQKAIARAGTIQARLALSVGRMCEERGKLRAAYTRYDRCLRLNREVGNRSGIADALLNLGNNLADRGEPAQAMQFYRECQTQYQDSGNRRGVAEALNNLGVLALETGDNRQALLYFEESIRLKHEIGDVRGEANSWCWLSEAKIRLADFVAAQKALRQSLILSHRIGAKDGSVRALFGFAVLAYAKQDRERAAVLLKSCEELRQQLGVRQFPRYLEEQAQMQNELSVALGNDYAPVVSEGSGLTLDQAIEYALSGSEAC